MMIRRSKDMVDRALSFGRTNSFFLGGGRSMLNALYRMAEKLGVQIARQAEVTDIEMDCARLVAARVKTPRGTRRLGAKSLVAAAGGFEGNIEWLKEGWGTSPTTS